MVLLQICERAGDADIFIVMEDHAFGFHLLDAPINMVLFHFEIRNAVAQQTTSFGTAFIKMHFMTGARQLLRRGHACGARTNDRDLLACFFSRQSLALASHF